MIPDGRTYAYYLSGDALDCIIEALETAIEARPELRGTLRRFITERESRATEQAGEVTP